MIQSQGELENDVVDECAIPNCKDPTEFSTPECGKPQLEGRRHGYILHYPGKTNDASVHSYIR